MPYTYPASALDRSDVLLGLLGSFWSDVYQGRDLVGQYLFARGQLNLQSHKNLQEGAATLSRFTTPILHTEHWLPLVLTESQRNNTAASFLHYGDPAIYGTQPSGELYKYGRPIEGSTYIFPLPAKLRDVRFITNLLFAPSVVYVQGVDFYVDPARQALVFRVDPFRDSRIVQGDVFTGTEVTDHLAYLWAFQARLDYDYLNMHWAYVLGATGPSLPTYRDFLNALFDGLVGGCAKGQITQALAAVLDAPMALTDEIIRDLPVDNNQRLIITDQHVYKCPLAAEPLIDIGNHVTAGTLLTDTVQVFELSRGLVPATLRAIVADKGLLVGAYLDGITFENKDVVLEVSTADDGHTVVEFEVGGFPEDVRRFWDTVDANGVAAGQTFAHLLDERADPLGEPAAGNLPTTINPLQFFVANILRNNFFVAQIKSDQAGRQALDLSLLRLLRKIIPPQTGLLLVLELALPRESIILDGPFSDDSPGYQESLTLQRNLEPFTESVDASLITEALTFRQVSDGCS